MCVLWYMSIFVHKYRCRKPSSLERTSCKLLRAISRFEQCVSTSLLQMGKLGSNPLAGLAALGLGGLATPANTGGLNPAGKWTTYYRFISLSSPLHSLFFIIVLYHEKSIWIFKFLEHSIFILSRPYVEIQERNLSNICAISMVM